MRRQIFTEEKRPMARSFAVISLLSLTVLTTACGQPPAPAAGVPVAFPAIDGNRVLEHTKTLASDAFEGRMPGSRGEDLTVAYIIDQFKKAGVKPGNPDGTFVQKVPMVGIVTDQKAVLSFRTRRDGADPLVARRLRRVDQAGRRHSACREIGRRVRRVRRAGARVRLGRLQGRRRQGQDHGGARWRPARCPTRPTRRSSTTGCSAAAR